MARDVSAVSSATKIDLSGCSLRGPIAREIGQLASLKFLNLERNQLDGEVPDEIGDCSSLQVLYLNHNRLRGRIPAALARCGALTLLQLQANRFTGSVPPELAHCTALTELAVFKNQRLETKASKAEIMRRLPLCAMTTTHKPARGKAHMLSSLTVSLPHEGGVESNKHQNPGAVVFRSRAPQHPVPM